ncbi:carboxymuconolactone decarboxylase family protein [Streptomyces sp. NPDC088560]|uniref:carboxymuconolactone decarboxylase family protein n=1 Tax=Streptomyces sp. NPDC088560 TaxID=3365868 RepID=UPI0037F1711A
MHYDENAQRYIRGSEIIEKTFGVEADIVLGPISEVAPDLSRYVAEFAYGDVYSRPGLSAEKRSLVTIAILASMGDCTKEIIAHVNGALNQGVTPSEIVETVIHTCLYSGFPRSLNAMHIVRKVFKERGIELPQPVAPFPEQLSRDKDMSYPFHTGS